MAVFEEIKEYNVMYFAGGKNTTGHEFRAIIVLRRDDGTRIGLAYFHRDPATMPDTDNQNPTGIVFCHYTWEDFPQVIDLLRNESPVFFRYVAGEWKTASITTATEPVGEGETP